MLAERAVASDVILVEGVVRTYPDDRALRILAATTRTTYAFAFVQDELEAVRLSHPTDRETAAALVARTKGHYAIARSHAETALSTRDEWREVTRHRPLEEVPPEELDRALAGLRAEDAEALFWLGFAWGGSLQVDLDSAAATALPKIEAILDRVLELDERVFYGLGPHLLAGVFHGFRAPALGGDPERATDHFERARALGGVLLPDVLLAQHVLAQTEQAEAFRATLVRVIEAEGRRDRALLEVLAKRKACRLLANLDQFFLEDPVELPEACDAVPRTHPYRAASTHVGFRPEVSS